MKGKEQEILINKRKEEFKTIVQFKKNKNWFISYAMSREQEKPVKSSNDGDVKSNKKMSEEHKNDLANKGIELLMNEILMNY